MKKLILLILAFIFVIFLIFWLNRIEEKYKGPESTLPEGNSPSTIPAPTTPSIEPSKPLPDEVDKKPEEIQGSFIFKPVTKEKWYPKLKKDLLAFENKSTKILIEAAPTSRFGENKQILLVSYVRKNGSRSSFKGLFDTKTGKIITTWDQTQFEPIHKKEVLISPSGGLK
jgi:hypothetical protein